MSSKPKELHLNGVVRDLKDLVRPTKMVCLIIGQRFCAELDPAITNG